MSHSLRQLRELFADPLLIRTLHGMRLSRLAAQLEMPLHKALRELALSVKLGPAFDAATAVRSFVIAPLPRQGSALSLANAGLQGLDLWGRERNRAARPGSRAPFPCSLHRRHDT